MPRRSDETIYIQAGVARKGLVKKACKLTKSSQAKLINAAIDREIRRLSRRFPQLNGVAPSAVADSG